MYKAILLLIILGLSIPLLHAKSTTGKKAQKKIANNAEEALDGTDFWDFDPHADADKASQPNPTDINDITPFKEAKKSKNKGPKGTFDELEQIVKDIELTIASFDKRNQAQPEVHFDRMLQLEVPAVANPPAQNVPQTSRLEENGETIVNEEDDNTDNGETGPLPGEEEEDEENGEGGTGPQPPEEEEEEDQTGGEPPQEEEEETGSEEPPQEEEEQDDGTTPIDTPISAKRGMGTVTLSGSIEYDTNFDTYDKASGKQTFINALASALDIDAASVRVTNIRRGSVIFDFEITSEVPSSSLQDAVVSNINDLDKKITQAVKEGKLNLPEQVMSYKREIIVFSPAEETNEPRGMGWIVAVAAVLSFVILSLIGWLVYQQKKLGGLAGDKHQKVKYQMPSEQGRADWESGQSQVVNESDSIRFYPLSPPNVLNYDGRNDQPRSPIKKSHGKKKSS